MKLNSIFYLVVLALPIFGYAEPKNRYVDKEIILYVDGKVNTNFSLSVIDPNNWLNVSGSDVDENGLAKVKIPETSADQEYFLRIITAEGTYNIERFTFSEDKTNSVYVLKKGEGAKSLPATILPSTND